MLSPIVELETISDRKKHDHVLKEGKMVLNCFWMETYWDHYSVYLV